MKIRKLCPLRTEAIYIIDKSTIEPTLGFFVADFVNFENGWEDLWKFHDFGWEFLYFGSNHTGNLYLTTSA